MSDAISAEVPEPADTSKLLAWLSSQGSLADMLIANSGLLTALGQYGGNQLAALCVELCSQLRYTLRPEDRKHMLQSTRVLAHRLITSNLASTTQAVDAGTAQQKK